MERGIGPRAAQGTGFAERRVEHEHGRVWDRAFPIGVKASAIELGSLACGVLVVPISCGDLLVQPLGMIGFHGWSPECSDQGPAHGKRLIANGFGWKPDSRCSGKKSVLGIFFSGICWNDRGLAIGRAGDDLPQQPFDVPSRIHEILSEPIEELGMGREVALGAEIFTRTHDAVSEEHLPESVNDDASGERIGRVDEPSCESEPIFWGVSGEWGQDGGSGCGHGIAFAIVGTAQKDVRWARLLHLLHHQGGGDLEFCVVDLLTEPLGFGGQGSVLD